ncbi:MAG: mltG [Nonomuraea muscovyensis]|nr:mltG [Nonomuraea muscovyensis]
MGSEGPGDSVGGDADSSDTSRDGDGDRASSSGGFPDDDPDHSCRPGDRVGRGERDSRGVTGEAGAPARAASPGIPAQRRPPGLGAALGTALGRMVPAPTRRAVPLPVPTRRGVALTAGIAASALALGAGAYAVLKPYLDPDDYEGAGSGAVTVRIRPGATAGDIGETLAGSGVVASARSFVNAAETRAVAHRLRPGHYRLRTGMAAAAALDLLLAPASRVVRRVTVTEGMRVDEAFRRIAAQSGLPLRELRAVEPELVGLPPYARGIEGFLYPATYEVEPDAKAVDVLAAMVERYGEVARQLDLEARAARVHLTPLEAVTVASIAQAEGGRDADYPKIARVIYNRLRRGMPLQMDATVTYALGRRTLRVAGRDLRVRSPYNTYARAGLPPAPISNPGRKALRAALRPAKGDWYWFVTTDPAHRITKFTDKESEFVRYREELHQNLGTN